MIKQQIKAIGIFLTLAGSVFAAKLPLEKSQSEVKFVVTGDVLTIHGKKADGYSDPHPLKGELVLKNGALSGTAQYDLKAITTGINMRDGHMKDKYLKVNEFPQAKITIEPTTIFTDATKAQDKFKDIPFKGTMEVKGITKPVIGLLTVEKKAKGKTDEETPYNLKFNWDLKLTDFGIDTPSFMEVTLTEKVSLSVDVTGTFL